MWGWKGLKQNTPLPFVPITKTLQCWSWEIRFLAQRSLNHEGPVHPQVSQKSSSSITGPGPHFHFLFIRDIPQCVYWNNSSVSTDQRKRKMYIADDTNVLYWTTAGTVDSVEKYTLTHPLNVLSSTNVHSHWNVLNKGSYGMLWPNNLQRIFLIFMSMWTDLQKALQSRLL
jgi:hypothetical protein